MTRFEIEGRGVITTVTATTHFAFGIGHCAGLRAIGA